MAEKSKLPPRSAVEGDAGAPAPATRRSSGTDKARWAACPRCERPVRLTEGELEAKRGFCANCDAEFELVRGAALDLGGPFRAGESLALVPTQSTRPPRTLMRVDERGVVTLAPEKPSLRELGIPALMAAIAVVGGLWVPALFTVAIFVALAASSVVRAFRRDRCAVHDGFLWTRVGLAGEARRIPLQAIQTIQIHDDDVPFYYLRIEHEGGPAVLVGHGLRQTQAEITWLKEWVELQVLQARERVAGERADTFSHFDT
jgi:hypothetical protein